MTELCERCGKNPWTAPVFLGSKPTEKWCDDCIQEKIDAGVNVAVLGDYFEIKKQKEVMTLLNSLRSAVDNECKSYCDYYGNGCGYSWEMFQRVNDIIGKMQDMWGE